MDQAVRNERNEITYVILVGVASCPMVSLPDDPGVRHDLVIIAGTSRLVVWRFGSRSVGVILVLAPLSLYFIYGKKYCLCI